MRLAEVIGALSLAADLSSGLSAEKGLRTVLVAKRLARRAVWAKLNDPRMAEYQKDLAPFVVPGSHRWEVFRVQEV